MAIKTYKSGAWVDIKGVNNAQAVRVHNGTSWIDIWTSMKTMTLLSNSITKGMFYAYDNGSMQYSKSLQYGEGSMTGGGTMVFYLDGEWVNPTITFDYSGNYMYETSNGNYISSSAGTVAIYHRVKGASSAGTTQVLSKVGVDMSIDSGVERGSVSKTLSGTYDRLGISFTIPTYSNSYSFMVLMLSIGELKIGSQKLRFPESAEFYYS